MGLVPLLRSVLGMPQSDTEASQKPVCVGHIYIKIVPEYLLLQPKVEVYGPAGIRTFIRSILKMTLTRTADRYVVHELLSPNDEVTPCTPPGVMHSSESQGRDIWAGEEDGFWRQFVYRGRVAVDAGPILHRGGSCTSNTILPNSTVKIHALDISSGNPLPSPVKL